MGVPPTFGLELAPPGPVVGEAAPSLEAALELARANRPEVRAARASVGVAEQGLSLSRKLELGTLQLSADYDIGLRGPKEDADAWAVVLTATGFLFDGGARRARVEQSRSQLESLRAQEQEALNTIGLEVESAGLDLETAAKSVEASAKSVASAEAQLAAARGKYREGVGIFVEILDAERAVVRARTSQVNAVYQYQTALLALKRATGTLELPAVNR
jgi:outer membrane protein TolC